MSSTTTLKIKVQLGKDIRLWHYPETDKYQSLLNFVNKTFNIDEKNFYSQYEDDEGDNLTLKSEQDFEDALHCVIESSKKSLKIFIIQGKIEDARVEHQQLRTEPTTEEYEQETKKINNYWFNSSKIE